MPENPRHKPEEKKPNSRFGERLAQLADPDSPKPLVLTDRDAKNALINLMEGGISFDHSLVEWEALVKGTQFRAKFVNGIGPLIYDGNKPKGERWVKIGEASANYHTDASGEPVDVGPGMHKSLGTLYGEFISVCHALAVDNGWGKVKIGGYDGTQGRGLQLFARDLIIFATMKFIELEITPESLSKRINDRVLKGHLRLAGDEAKKRSLLKAFGKVEDYKPSSKMASVPPSAILPLWNYLTNNEEITD